MRYLGTTLLLWVAVLGGVPAACEDLALSSQALPLQFPQDEGSHPQFRTEWWYVTGWLSDESGQPLGFQVTFFRTKPQVDSANPSAFLPAQLLIAHCALSDPKLGRLWQDQRIRRAGMGLAGSAQGNTEVWLERWSLKHQGANYTTRIDAEDFALDLTLAQTQSPLINGAAGLSRKGPNPRSTSYYYSLPQMRVQGVIVRKGIKTSVTGVAWFDHEWSNEYLDAKAIGWDWMGINFDDGAALMAFRIRGAGDGVRWAGGTYRAANGEAQTLDPGEVDWRSLRRWISPRTGISYPVNWQVRAGGRNYALEPLMDDQENDTRLSTGAIYWEGAVRALQGQRVVGRGYLELTGYGEKLTLR